MQAATTLLLANTLLLGLRHGLDFDHLAAISDIAGANASNGTAALRLSGCYAFGHALAVTCLGTAVIFAGNFMPAWIEAIAEKLVAGTLILLGCWLLYSRSNRLKGRGNFDAAGAQRVGIATTLGIGAIHGIGAETGTQMLLLATVGGTTNVGVAFSLLVVFVVGLLISNTFIAFASAAGFTRTVQFRTVSDAFAVAAALFSIWLGIEMML